jgi:hypothetical protein
MFPIDILYIVGYNDCINQNLDLQEAMIKTGTREKSIRYGVYVMYEGTKALSEKENSIQEFTVMFWEDHLIADNNTIPLGLVSAEVLDYPDDKLFRLRSQLDSLMKLMKMKFFNPDIKKDLTLVTAAQDKLNEVLDFVFEMPLFRLLDMDRALSKSMLLTAYEEYPEEFQQMVIPGTPENTIIMEYLLKLVTIPDELHSFKTYTASLLDLYFERLKQRNKESYAVGVYDFFSNTKLLNTIAASLPPSPFQSYRQACSAMIEYTTMLHPERKTEYIIAERMVFHHLGESLHVDFFRGLMHGHTPRRCRNCGQFFLLTEGYNTLYCNRIAPGETEKTCQKVGAHRIAMENQKYKSPERKLYDAVYNRLKTRHHRKKLSDDEWNKAVALAWEYKEKAEKGELQFHELEEIYLKM